MYFTSLKHAVHKDTPVLPSLEKKKIDTFKKKTTLLNSCFTTSDYLLLYQLKHQFATGSFRYSKIALYNSITTDYCNIERSSPLEKDGSSSAQVPITIWRNFWSKLSLTCASQPYIYDFRPGFPRRPRLPLTRVPPPTIEHLSDYIYIYLHTMTT